MRTSDASCSTRINTTIDSVGNVGQYTSITIGADGYPVISYYDDTNSHLKVAKCGNASCFVGNTLTAVDSGTDGGYNNSSITIGADGYPLISYYDYNNHTLKIAKCGNASCSSGNTLTTVDSAAYVGQYTSITIGADGYPVISYYDNTNHTLKVAKCANQYCLNNWWRR